VDTSDLLQVRKAIQNNTRLVYLETPANPTLRLGDISAIAKITHTAGAKLVVDSTFATPILQTPLALGADLVIHSLTKYLNGHGDSLGGMVLGAEDLIHTIRKDMLVHLGGAMSPFNAWLVLRGLETLSLRMARHSQSAGKIAEYLENHRAIERVFYPGLASHPQHALAESQMVNSGGMIAFRLKRGLAGAIDFAEKAQLLTYATSLGHPSSLFFFYPTDLYLREMDFLPEAQKAQIKRWMGDAGLLRLSVGLEDPEDLLEDISRALQSRTFKGLVGPLLYRLMQRG
jgi:cystathionine beta-lyase/cystathionine gamma-synthase